MVSPKAGIPNPVRVVGNAGIPPEPLYHIIARLGHSSLYNLVYAWILAPCTITLSHLKPGFNSPRKGIPLKGRPRTTITRYYPDLVLLLGFSRYGVPFTSLYSLGIHSWGIHSCQASLENLELLKIHACLDKEESNCVRQQVEGPATEELLQVLVPVPLSLYHRDFLWLDNSSPYQ